MATASTEWLLYGANGFTGCLIAELAASRGHKPVLAGRSEGKLRPLAERLGLPFRAFALDDPRALDEGLRGMGAVLHCAGPFSATSRPMVDACLRAGVHYLDVTGEVDVFEGIYSRHEEARARGVTLIPGVGFDVVPTDCLAALLHQRLPSARELELAFAMVRGGSSAGTMKSAIEALPLGGRVRRGGKLVSVPSAHARRTVKFADRARTTMAIPWGDLSSAFRTTAIPEITVFIAAPWSMIALARASGLFAFALRQGAVQRFLKAQVERRVQGPTPAQRKSSRVELWGRAADDVREVELTMTVPEGYGFTAEAALAAVLRTVASAKPGARTPSQAFGPEFAQSLPGVTVHP